MNCRVTLSKRETTTNSIGNKVETITNQKTIFANKESIGLNGFYSAKQSSFKLVAKITIKKTAYNNQNYVELLPGFGETLDGTIYKVDRTYQISNDHIELWIGETINNG